MLGSSVFSVSHIGHDLSLSLFLYYLLVVLIFTAPPDTDHFSVPSGLLTYCTNAGSIVSMYLLGFVRTLQTLLANADAWCERCR